MILNLHQMNWNRLLKGSFVELFVCMVVVVGGNMKFVTEKRYSWAMFIFYKILFKVMQYHSELSKKRENILLGVFDKAVHMVHLIVIVNLVLTFYLRLGP